MNVGNGENSHDDVYGQTFALYTDDELDEFSRFFERRFRANHIDPQVLFNGRAVLDAGCGNGRGALFAARHGALEVSTVDVSQTNIETTQRHLWKAGARIGTLQAGTLERLQFESESFDVVWCNGVLMHTAEPDTCLKEITRVLKIGGNAWIYVYGAGGIYWRFIRQFREMTQGIPAGRCISILQRIGCGTRFIAEYLDDWKVAYLRTYTAKDFTRRLIELGYDDPVPLPYGVAYDTSHRIATRSNERQWWGEGDLRYLVRKSARAPIHEHPISSSPCGSDYTFDPVIEEEFGETLFDLATATKGDDELTVSSCAFVQRRLRHEMSKDTLDVNAIRGALNEAISRATRGK